MKHSKLNIAIVDDDPGSHHTLNGILKGSSIVGNIYNFSSADGFLKKAHSLEFDLCFLDCFFENESKQGVDLAFKIKKMNKLFIFISAKNSFFVEACKTIGALDAMPKPNTSERVLEGLDKAFFQLNAAERLTNPDYISCFTAEERKGKRIFHAAEFFYIVSDKIDHRNKEAQLVTGELCTLMNATFQELEMFSTDLVLVNRSAIVSVRGIYSYTHEYVIMKKLPGKAENTKFLIGRECRDKFLSNFK